MSDDEYEYDTDVNEIDSKMESEDNEQSDDQVEMMNSLYLGHDIKKTNPEKAIEHFKTVLEFQLKLGVTDETFDALENIVTLNFTLGSMDIAMNYFVDDLLAKLSLSKTDNATMKDCMKVISNILEYTAQHVPFETHHIMVQSCLEILHTDSSSSVSISNEWLACNLKLGELCLLSTNDATKLGMASSIVNDVHMKCKLFNGSDDSRKLKHLFEVYVLKMKLFLQRNDKEQLLMIYPKMIRYSEFLTIDKRKMSFLRLEGGKLYMRAHCWDEAIVQFRESLIAFNFDDQAAKKKLMYLVCSDVRASSVTQLSHKQTSSLLFPIF